MQKITTAHPNSGRLRKRGVLGPAYEKDNRIQWLPGRKPLIPNTVSNVCPHCCSDRGIQFVCSASYTASSYSLDMRGRTGATYTAKAFVGRCSACGGLTVFDDRGACLNDADFLEAEMAYPENRCTHGAIPEKVRDLYQTALRIKWIDTDAFAVRIRKAIEVICREESVVGRTLEAKLTELQKMKGLPPNVAAVAKKLRLLGNRAAHDSEGLHPLYAHVVDDFFCVLVDYLYVLPYRLSYSEGYDRLCCEEGGQYANR